MSETPHDPLTDDVRAALLQRTGADGEVLALVEAYEAGQWDEVKQRAGELHIQIEDLGRAYLEALPWGSDGSSPTESRTPRGGEPAASAVTERTRLGVLRRFAGWLRSLLPGARRVSAAG